MRQREIHFPPPGLDDCWLTFVTVLRSVVEPSASSDSAAPLANHPQSSDWRLALLNQPEQATSAEGRGALPNHFAGLTTLEMALTSVDTHVNGRMSQQVPFWSFLPASPSNLRLAQYQELPCVIGLVVSILVINVSAESFVLDRSHVNSDAKLLEQGKQFLF